MSFRNLALVCAFASLPVFTAAAQDNDTKTTTKSDDAKATNSDDAKAMDDNARSPNGTPVNPHDVRNKDRKMTGKTSNRAIENAEVDNPHSTANRNRSMQPAADTDAQVDAAEANNPHHAKARKAKVHTGAKVDADKDDSGQKGDPNQQDADQKK